jgi:hypothetical protein
MQTVIVDPRAVPFNGANIFTIPNIMNAVWARAIADPSALAPVDILYIIDQGTSDQERKLAHAVKLKLQELFGVHERMLGVTTVTNANDIEMKTIEMLKDCVTYGQMVGVSADNICREVSTKFGIVLTQNETAIDQGYHFNNLTVAFQHICRISCGKELECFDDVVCESHRWSVYPHVHLMSNTFVFSDIASMPALANNVDCLVVDVNNVCFDSISVINGQRCIHQDLTILRDIKRVCIAHNVELYPVFDMRSIDPSAPTVETVDLNAFSDVVRLAGFGRYPVDRRRYMCYDDLNVIMVANTLSKMGKNVRICVSDEKYDDIVVSRRTNGRVRRSNEPRMLPALSDYVEGVLVQLHLPRNTQSTPYQDPVPVLENVLRATFKQNVAGATCQQNVMGAACQQNVMGSVFQQNAMGAACQQNAMGSVFQQNAMGAACQQNVMGSVFQQNVGQSVPRATMTSGHSVDALMPLVRP